MGIIIQTKKAVTAICDDCRSEIQDAQTVVELGSHGIAFHQDCFVKLSAGRLLRLMGEDETLVYQLGADKAVPLDQARVRDASQITAASYPRSEMVQWRRG